MSDPQVFYAVVHPSEWKMECDAMEPSVRALYPPDGTLGDVGIYGGARIIVQDKIPALPTRLDGSYITRWE
jgi:hypothetical protein